MFETALRELTGPDLPRDCTMMLVLLPLPRSSIRYAANSTNFPAAALDIPFQVMLALISGLG